MKTALIIGGSTGIGLDIAKRLGARGAAVTITGRDTSKLDKAAAGIKQTGSPMVTTKAVDLYDRAQVDSLATELSTGAALDCLVNSAGYFFPLHSSNTRARIIINTTTSTNRFSS
jgi:short-subunit dehydrogenase